MKFILLSIFLFLNSENKSFNLKNGDLIFQESCLGEADNTIKEVTSSMGDYHFTHVGVVYVDGEGNTFVLEATPPKVALTPLKDYLHPKGKCSPLSVVGRLKREYRNCIPQALQEGLSLVGKEYDYSFTLNDDRYYCSELVYDILLKSNHNTPVFPLNIMTFKSERTGEFTTGWIEYYQKLGMDIPEGELGINPGAMSRSDVIDIVYCNLKLY